MLLRHISRIVGVVGISIVTNAHAGDEEIVMNHTNAIFDSGVETKLVLPLPVDGKKLLAANREGMQVKALIS